MAKMYYLFSKTGCLESIYVCDNGDYIETPIMQTGVYPMGTLLSKAIKTLMPWFENGMKSILGEEMLTEEFNKFSIQDSSFSNVACDDSAVRTVLELLLINRKHINTYQKHSRIVELLKCYMNYICLCQNQRAFSSIEKLTLLSNQNGSELPRRSIYMTDKSRENDTLSKDKIARILSNDLPEHFAPALKKQQARPFFDSPSIQTKATSWGALTTPFYVFNIHDIVDFVLASLQCIFEQVHVLGKCKFCGGLFITHDHKRLYCPEQIPDKKKASCYANAKLERQLAAERASESKKIHKSKSAMLSSRIYNTTLQEREIRAQEYNDFISKTAIIREEHTLSEEEYIAWMNQYWEDVKSKAKIRRKSRNKK